MRPISLLIACWFILTPVQPAWAATTSETACPKSGQDYVRLSFDEANPTSGCSPSDPSVLSRIRDLILADLSRDSVTLCDNLPQAFNPPLATIIVSSNCEGQPSVRIVVSDTVTQKESSRVLSLSGLPRDAHALAIAVGAVELLRASWAESRGQGSAGKPSAGAATVPVPTLNESRVFGSTTIGVVGEAFSGGLRQMGLDAQVALAITKRLDVHTRFGGRTSRYVTTTNGQVTADAWVLGAGLSYQAFRPSPKVEVRLAGRLDSAWLSFSAVPKGKAIALHQSGLLMWPSAGLQSDVRLVDNAWLLTEVAFGWVVLPIVATDNGKSVLGAQGAYVQGRLGVRISF